MQAVTSPASADSRWKSIGFGWVLLWALCVGLDVSSSVSHADEVDPAGRVARISYLNGPVYVQTTDDDSWSDAKINRPLTSSDQLWTDAQGRSELQMGSTTVQVDGNTQLRITELTDNQLRLVVTQGLINVRVRESAKDDVEITTPNATVRPVAPGTYRVEVVDNDDLTIVQVRDGEAEITGAKQDFTLEAGEQLRLRGSKRLSAEFDELARLDEFDRWARERNERAERVASSRYVSADVIGYEDLDDYGSWRQYDDYGYVWIPTRVHSGWAPYRYGHWTWVSPWGWTWIDDAPWGFAPFHYGRWAMLDRRWCWVPGPRTVRAVYAPALVAWVGSPSVSVSINIGRQPVGWIPLGPREVYRPYYHGSRDYITRINLSSTQLNNSEFERGFRRQPHDDVFRNRGAASVVQADALRTAQPVNNHLMRSGLRQPGREQLQPLPAQPVAAPERDETNLRARQMTPPIAPNTRDALPQREFGRRDDAIRHEPRNDDRMSNPGADMSGSNRNNYPDRWHGNRRDDIPAANDVGAPDSRHLSRDRYNGDPRIPGNQDSRAARPETAPRIRNEYGIRDEMRLGRPDSSGRIYDRKIPPVPMERHRDVRTPNDPPAMRRAPEPMPSPPMSTPAPSSYPDGGRPQRGGDQNEGRGHGRDIR